MTKSFLLMYTLSRSQLDLTFPSTYQIWSEL